MATLQFENNGLRGSLPSEVFFLESLEVLSMYDNNVQGQLPDNIGRLSSLIHIDIERNLFSNTLPTALSNMTQLSTFVANSNRLTGMIPDLQLLTNLAILTLGDNRLSGVSTFPGVVDSGVVPEMIGIYFKLNRLKGTIDKSICNSVNLET